MNESSGFVLTAPPEVRVAAGRSLAVAVTMSAPRPAGGLLAVELGPAGKHCIRCEHPSRIRLAPEPQEVKISLTPDAECPPGSYPLVVTLGEEHAPDEDFSVLHLTVLVVPRRRLLPGLTLLLHLATILFLAGLFLLVWFLRHDQEPSWAAAIGSDAYGKWADLRLGPACQRFRWIPPASGQGGFWLADTECTQEFYEAVQTETRKQWTGQVQPATDTEKITPGFFRGPLRPVESLTWWRAVGFLKNLTSLRVNIRCRLPNQAEWERAARAGTTTRTAFGDGCDLDALVCSPCLTTAAVRSRLPNPWGLYDCHGNVAEWCLDADPDGTKRAACGGAWNSPSEACSSSSRAWVDPACSQSTIGFRILIEGDAP